MILFCDTSALIKLLISEPGSDQMMESSLRAEAIAVCRITWAEAMAGMARRQRDDPISGDDIEEARQRQRLVETAGRFGDVFRLLGYDSVQLAASHELHSNGDQPVLFASSWRCWHDHHTSTNPPTSKKACRSLRSSCRGAGASRPFRIAGLLPVQMSNPKVLGILAKGRAAFTTPGRQDCRVWVPGGGGCGCVSRAPRRASGLFQSSLKRWLPWRQR